MERSKYYTPPEAASEMMCSALHVRQLIARRELPVYKVGSRSYIPKKAVEDYITSKTISSMEEHENEKVE